MVEMDGVAQIRRRARGSLPRLIDPDDAGHVDRDDDGSRVGDDKGWIHGLKSVWGGLIDRIDEVMKSGRSKISPRGNLTTDEILALWGTVTWPIVFLTGLRSKLTGSDTLLNDEYISLLKISIEHGIQSESTLNNELRANISLSHAYNAVLRSVAAENKNTFQFDKAVALLATSVKEMQSETGIHIDDSFTHEFSSLPILAHFSVSGPDDDGLTTSHTGPVELGTSSSSSTSSSSTSSSSTSSSTTTTTSGPNDHMVGNIRFRTCTTPAHLLVVGLQHCEMSPELMDHICHETAASLEQPLPESMPNITRGILFSDTQTGVACIAVSELPGLSAEINESGSKLVLNEKERFFDDVFSGALSPNELISVGVPANCSWDASPDIQLGFEW